MYDTVTAMPPDLGIERNLFGTTVPGLISVCNVTPWRELLTCVQSPGNCVVNPGPASACVWALAAAGRPPSTMAAAATARIDLITPDYPRSGRAMLGAWLALRALLRRLAHDARLLLLDLHVARVAPADGRTARHLGTSLHASSCEAKFGGERLVRTVAATGWAAAVREKKRGRPGTRERVRGGGSSADLHFANDSSERPWRASRELSVRSRCCAWQNMRIC